MWTCDVVYCSNRFLVFVCSWKVFCHRIYYSSNIGFITPPILDSLLLQYWIYYSSNIGFITPPISDLLLLQYRIYYSSNIGFITPPILDLLLLQHWIYYSSNIGFINSEVKTFKLVIQIPGFMNLSPCVVRRIQLISL